MPPLPKQHKVEKHYKKPIKPKYHSKPKHHKYKKHHHKPHYPRQVESYVWARVLHANPVYDTYQSEECYEERYYYQEHGTNHHGNGAEVVGAIIGGVVGHQFGDGRGKDLATVGGAVIGAAIGHDISKNSHNDVTVSSQHARTEYHCEPGYQRLIGYDVKYRYRGHTYFHRMHDHPGDQIRIRIGGSSHF